MQFTCPSCESVLEVETSTVKVDCPVCLATLEVHDQQTVHEPPSDFVVCGICGTQNPAAAIVCDFCGSSELQDDAAATTDELLIANARQSDAIESAMELPDRIRLEEVFSTTSRIFSRNFGVIIAVTLLEFAMFIAFLIPPLFLFLLVMFWARGGGPAQTLAVLPATFALVMAIWVIYHSQHAGHYAFMLKLARGQRASPADLFGHGKVSTKLIALSFPHAAFVLLGTAAFILPGLIVLLLLWPYGRLVVDRNPPGIQSLMLAGELTRKHFGNVVSIFFVFFGIQFVVGAIPLLALATTPFGSLGLTVAYLRMTNQPTVVDVNRAKQKLQREVV